MPPRYDAVAVTSALEFSELVVFSTTAFSLAFMDSLAMTFSFVRSFMLSTLTVRPFPRRSRYSVIDSPGLMKNRRIAMSAISSELSCMPVAIQR